MERLQGRVPPSQAAAPRGPICPACGIGDRLALALRGGDGRPLRAAYCGGVYDRLRRRYVLASCGWSGPDEERIAPADGPPAATAAGGAMTVTGRAISAPT